MCNKAKTPKSLRTAPAPRDIPTCDTDVLPPAPAPGTQTPCSQQSCRRATPRRWRVKTAAGNSLRAAEAEWTTPPVQRSQRKECETADALRPTREKNTRREPRQKELSLHS